MLRPFIALSAAIFCCLGAGFSSGSSERFGFPASVVVTPAAFQGAFGRGVPCWLGGRTIPSLTDMF